MNGSLNFSASLRRAHIQFTVTSNPPRLLRNCKPNASTSQPFSGPNPYPNTAFSEDPVEIRSGTWEESQLYEWLRNHRNFWLCDFSGKRREDLSSSRPKLSLHFTLFSFIFVTQNRYTFFDWHHNNIMRGLQTHSKERGRWWPAPKRVLRALRNGSNIVFGVFGTGSWQWDGSC